jgi:magnesium-dependent phosphatase 1
MARLIVFDLDLTLWHCTPLLWCDQLTPPLRRNESGQVFASCRNEIRLYPEVREMLTRLTAKAHLLGLASRTSAPAIARELLDLFGIGHHFAHQHIYPGDKSAHFRALHEETGIAFRDMIFFDDEHRNIESVSRLGVAAHLVPSGMNATLLAKALTTV